MRNIDEFQSRERSRTVDHDLIEQFKRLINVLEAKTINSLPSQGKENKRVVLDPQGHGSIMNQMRPHFGSPSQDYGPKVCYSCGEPGHFRNTCIFRIQNFGTQMSYFRHQMLHPKNNGNLFQAPPQAPPICSDGWSSYHPRIGSNQMDRVDRSAEREQRDRISKYPPTNCTRNQPATCGASEICQLCDVVGHTARNCFTIRQGNYIRSAH